MNCHYREPGMPRWPRVGRHGLVGLAAILGVAGCSRNRAAEPITPRSDDAWVQAACSPAHVDFSAWPRRSVGRVTIAVPPGYVVEQGPQTNISVRGSNRRTGAGLTFHHQDEAQATYDLAVYRERHKRSICRMTLSGYPAEVVATYEGGEYELLVFWGEHAWGGEGGEWPIGAVTGSRFDEAWELRAILHSIQPAGAG